MLWWLIGGLALLAALLYWQFILTEGVYLGRRVVVWLYDLGAKTYDKVKEYDADDEAFYLGEPLAQRLAGQPQARVLDVATGTGRLPLALFQQPQFQGVVVGLDASKGMLEQASAKLADYWERVVLVHHDATRLPFPADYFEAVTCLEALEFLPDPDASLSEIVRVLKPGATLLVTNRVGVDRLFFPSRTTSTAAFIRRLTDLGLTDIQPQPWMTYYDLVWATKSTK